MIVQSGVDKADIWTKPSGLEFNKDNATDVLGQVKGKFRAVMMDGSVREVSVDVDYLALLIQYADMQRVPDEFRAVKHSNHESDASAAVRLPPLEPRTNRIDLRYIPSNATAIKIFQVRRLYSDRSVQAVRANRDNVDSKRGGFVMQLGQAKAPRFHKSDLQIQGNVIDELMYIDLPSKTATQSFEVDGRDLTFEDLY